MEEVNRSLQTKRQVGIEEEGEYLERLRFVEEHAARVKAREEALGERERRQAEREEAVDR